MNIGIYIYEQVEVLDFAGPFEVFSTASRISETGDLFSVSLIGETGAALEARSGFRVTPAHRLHHHPALDVVIIPGGIHTNELAKPTVIRWIAETAKTATLTASVCTGAFLLAEAEVVTTQTVTTHWEDISDLRDAYPDLDVAEGVRWVDAGDVVTAAGISAGIDMSLHLVSRLHSMDLAERTAIQMEFDWTRNANCGV